MTRIAKLLGAAAIALGAGCGGSSSPNVNGSTQISATTDADKMSLCNWFAGLSGGYGSAPTCSMAVITAPPSEAECVSSFPDCAVPVSTFEACVRTIVAAQNTCTQASIAMAESDPNCATVGQAGCFN
jgi:hypothetical protein